MCHTDREGDTSVSLEGEGERAERVEDISAAGDRSPDTHTRTRGESSTEGLPREEIK